MTTADPLISCGADLLQGLSGSGRRTVLKTLTTELLTAAATAGAGAGGTVSAAWAPKVDATRRAMAERRAMFMCPCGSVNGRIADEIYTGLRCGNAQILTRAATGGQPRTCNGMLLLSRACIRAGIS